MVLAELNENETERRFEISWKRPVQIETPELPVLSPDPEPEPEPAVALVPVREPAPSRRVQKNGWKPGLPSVDEDFEGFRDTGKPRDLGAPAPRALPSLKDRMVADALRGSIAPARFNARTLAEARLSGRQAREEAARLEIRKQKDAARLAKAEARRIRQQQLEAEAPARADAPAPADQPAINADVLAMFGM